MISTKDQWKSFRNKMPILFQGEGFEIRRGDLFEAKTVKGNTNLLLVMRIDENFVYYMQPAKPKTDGDTDFKMLKVKNTDFLTAIEHGVDIWPVDLERVDTERIGMGLVMIDAFANRSSMSETMDVMEDNAIESIMDGSWGKAE